MGEEIWKRCLDHLVKWEGRDNIEEYIRTMDEKLVFAGKEMLSRFLIYYPK
jgi:hypothetical protein